MVNTEYLKEFHKYWDLENPPINTNPIINKINYYFGTEKQYLTKENLANQQKFIQTILKHSKPSELELDIKRETEIGFC
jgi:hypothetical protein